MRWSTSTSCIGCGRRLAATPSSSGSSWPICAVTANYRAAGAAYLVLAGVVVRDRRRYEKALGEPVLLCRLRVPLDRVGERLVGRHEPGDARDWHVRRAPQLEQLLDDADTADLTIDVGDEPPAALAGRVLAATSFAD